MKRIIAFLLILIFAFSFGAYAEESENQENTTINLSLCELIGADTELLNKSEITNGEAAELYCLAMKLDNNAAEKDKNEAYLSVAYENGWLSSAKSDEKITMYDFLKGFVKLLGYSQKAELKGYSVVINELKLLKGTKGGAYAVLTGYNAIAILNNALEAPMLTQVVFGDKTEHIKSSDVNLLTEYHKLSAVEGFLTATELTSLYKSEGVGENKIMIGTTVYNSLSDATDFLGKQVKVYVNEDDEVVAISEISGKNKELTFALDYNSQIYGENSYFICEKDSKKTKKKLNGNASYIYNGVFDVDFGINDLKNLKNGSVRLLDYDNDGVFDVVFINEYVNYYVRAITEDKIFDEYAKAPIYYTSEEVLSVSVIKDGKSLNVSDISYEIKNGDVVSLFKSKNGRVIKLYASSEKIFDEVTEKKSEKNYELYKIGDGFYETAFSGSGHQALDVGEWGNIYFDAFGKIAALDLKSTIDTYGFLTGISQDGVFDSNIKFRIMTKIGKQTVFDLNEKVYLNGIRYNNEDLPTLLGSEPQIISYNLNSDGKISELKTAGTGGITHSASESSIRWRSSSNTFGSKYVLDNTTAVFQAPSKLATCDPVEDIYTVARSELSDKQLYNIEVYDADDFGTASVVVVHNAPDFVKFGYEIYFVKYTTTMLNSDGELINSIHCDDRYGQETILYTNEECYGKIQAGTGIRVKKDSDGFVKETDVVFKGETGNISDKYIAGDSYLGVGAECVVAQGKIAKTDSGRFTLENSSYTYKYSASYLYCAEYDPTHSDNFIKISPYELQAGDTVYIVKSNDTVVSIIKMN